MLRPRSIQQLVLVAFLIVLLPLLGALIYGGRTMSRMSEEHRDHIVNVSESAEYLQKVASDLVSVERLARQFLLLGDSSILQLFNEQIATLDEDVQPFLSRTSAMADSVRTMIELKERLTERLNRERKLAAYDGQTLRWIDSLNHHLQELRRETDFELQSHVHSAKARAENTQTTLIILGCTVIPGTVLLVGLFSMLITRPIRGIDQSIRDIGSGVYKESRSNYAPKDLKLLAERLSWLSKRLHTSEESQERFLRHISHELKTPLATIKEGIELLADEVPGPLVPSQRDVLNILQTGLLHFQSLINNLLDFNLMRSDLHLKKEGVELQELIAGAIRPYLLTAQRKKLQFETSGQALTLNVDRSVIAAAMDNLLSNAVHFSPDEGKITVQWQLSERGVSVLVGDEGPGIPIEERSKVFLPFYQGKALRTGPLKGTGLGLSVARECVESHKGLLSILESQRGAWFEMFLPLEGALESQIPG